MIYVKEYYCGEEVEQAEYIGLTTFEIEAEAIDYANKQKEKDIYCDVYDEAYMLCSTFPACTPETITEKAIAELGRFLEG